MKTNNTLTFTFSFLFSYLVYFLFHNIHLYYYALPIAALSSLLLLTYTSRRHYFYFVLAGLLIGVFSGVFPIKFSFEIISVSMIIQSLLIKKLAIKTVNLSSKLEVRRDLVQIVIGGVFLSILVFSYKQVLLALVFLGILVAHIIFVYVINAAKGTVKRNIKMVENSMKSSLENMFDISFYRFYRI